MSDIIAFVNKTIENNLLISTDEEYSISIYNENKFIGFVLHKDYLTIKTDNGITRIDITQKDEYQYKVLIEDCIEYNKKKALEDFNNFFKKEFKPTSINDLDNEDD